MNLKNTIESFSKLPAQRQIRCLVLYSHELTIVARDTYAPGTDEVSNPRELRKLNEIQHRVVGHVAKLLADDKARYPDDVLLKTVVPKENKILLEAFGKAMGYVT